MEISRIGIEKPNIPNMETRSLMSLILIRNPEQ